VSRDSRDALGSHRTRGTESLFEQKGAKSAKVKKYLVSEIGRGFAPPKLLHFSALSPASLLCALRVLLFK
jgi:hypothetical protein